MTWFEEAQEILQIVHEEIKLMCWKEKLAIGVAIAAFGAACSIATAAGLLTYIYQ